MKGVARASLALQLLRATKYGNYAIGIIPTQASPNLAPESVQKSDSRGARALLLQPTA